MKVLVISGDITKVDADAMITAINSGGLWFGGIDGAIQRVAGNYYHKQAAQEELRDHTVVVARGNRSDHSGNFDNVIFVVDDLKSELRSVIAVGLAEADASGFETVSIPAIRTGVMLGVVEKSLEQVVNEWIFGVKRYLMRTTLTMHTVPRIQTIKFVIYKDPELEEILHNALRKEGWL